MGIRCETSRRCCSEWYRQLHVVCGHCIHIPLHLVSLWNVIRTKTRNKNTIFLQPVLQLGRNALSNAIISIHSKVLQCKFPKPTYNPHTAAGERIEAHLQRTPEKYVCVYNDSLDRHTTHRYNSNWNQVQRRGGEKKKTLLFSLHYQRSRGHHQIWCPVTPALRNHILDKGHTLLGSLCGDGPQWVK